VPIDDEIIVKTKYDKSVCNGLENGLYIKDTYIPVEYFEIK